MKTWAKISIKIVAFLLVFIVLFFSVQEVLRFKWAPFEGIYDRMESYKSADEEVDVLYLGSSPILAGVSPIVIWKERGITGFNFGLCDQNALCTYYILEQMLEYHTPKLVVLDFQDFTVTRKIDENSRYASAYYKTMELSSPLRKIELLKEIKATSENVNLINCAFPLIQDHASWTDLGKGDFTYLPVYWLYHEYQKGAYQKNAAINVKPNQRYYSVDGMDENGNYYASDFAVTYYRKIVELCKSKNIQVAGLTLPNTYIPSESKYNLIQDFCDEYGLKYLNYNTYENREKLGIQYDENSDFYDWGHMNINGNIKLSKELARVLSEEFGLENHSNDSAYASWNDDWEAFYKDFEEILKKHGY